MYIAVTGKDKAKVIQLRRDTRIPGTNKKKIQVIRTIGNYEKMLAEDPDVLTKLREEARRLTEQEKEANAPLTLTISNQELVSPDQASASYRFGHALILQIWRETGLDPFIQRHCGKRNAADVSRAIQGLLIHRLTDPCSVRATAEDLAHYAGIETIGLDVYYQALDVLSAVKEPVVERLCRFFEAQTSRTGPMAYYDVTTHSFESVRQGELRMFGFSKSHKNNEVQVVMGLLIDNNGIPITFELFPGNTMDQKTLRTAVEALKEKYRLEKIVIVADRGLNGKDNLNYLLEEGHDFVFAYTLKRAPLELQDMALDPAGWQAIRYDKQDEMEWKEKVLNREIPVKVELSEMERMEIPRTRGRPQKYKTVEIPVRIHLTWSRKRAEKDRKDRERVLEKTRRLLNDPGKITQSLKHGKNQYLKLNVDVHNSSLDENRIAHQEQFDGYYAIVTNDLKYSTAEVCNLYGGLWKIEESFRVLKTDLSASPVFVWKDEHVKGHFMLCYLALCLLRYAQYLLLTEKRQTISATVLMESWYRPMALALGEYPNTMLIPTQVPQSYFDLADCLKMNPMRTCMTIGQFKKATKLNINLNLTADNRTAGNG